MAYLYLTLAIIGELTGTTLMKYSNGFTRIFPAIGCLAAYAACFFFFSKSLQNINLSIAYATWSGIGIIASTVISVYLFKESISLLGILGIVLIVAGVILLNLFGTGSAH